MGEVVFSSSSNPAPRRQILQFFLRDRGSAVVLFCGMRKAGHLR
jgi:hypothetical protein